MINRQWGAPEKTQFKDSVPWESCKLTHISKMAFLCNAHHYLLQSFERATTFAYAIDMIFFVNFLVLSVCIILHI